MAVNESSAHTIGSTVAATACNCTGACQLTGVCPNFRPLVPHAPSCPNGRKCPACGHSLPLPWTTTPWYQSPWNTQTFPPNNHTVWC